MKHNNIPEKIRSTIRLDFPNEKINIYEGAGILVLDKTKIAISKLTLIVNWFPAPLVKMVLKHKPKNDAEAMAFLKANKFQLEVNGLPVGTGHISLINSANAEYNVEGKFNSKVILGDSSINCFEIDFALLNFKQFLGASVKETLENGAISFSKGRIKLIDKDYEIILDKIEKEGERLESLKNMGGFLQLYEGKILSKKERGASYDEVFEVINKLFCFLTFINGRRTCPIFLTGKFEGSILWQDFSLYKTDPYKSFYSWSDKFHPEAFSDLWINFSDLWSNENTKDVLSTAIHWYVEANNNSGYVEGALVMSQTALELLYNWYVVEEKKIIQGSDSKNISASNKIRLLLTSLGYYELDTPADLIELKSFITESKDISNCIEAIVFIRNSIIHSEERKRKELKRISNKIKYEALQLSIWYIEISLLKILNYWGHYHNRTHKKKDFQF